MSNPNVIQPAIEPAGALAENPDMPDMGSEGLGARSRGLVSRIGEAASQIKDAVHTGYDYVAERYDSLKFGVQTAAAIGGVAFVGAQAAELVSPEPVVARTDTPEAETSAASFRKKCVRQGTARPATSAILRHPGDEDQEFRGKVNVYGLSEECDEAGYTQAARIRVRMEDPRRDGKKVDLIRGKSLRLVTPPAGLVVMNVVSVKPDGQTGRRVYFRPTPGRGETDVTQEITEIVRNPQGKKIGQRTYRSEVDVMAPRSRR